MQGPDTDGGQWAMAVSLIRKYGLVPTYAQDESFTANNTAAFNSALNMKLREDGLVLRKLYQEKKMDEIETKRQEFLSEVYRMAVIAFGEPVQKFDLEFKDDNCYGIIGANGAGKSTFLKLLSGEIDSTSGEVILGKNERLSVLKQNHNEFNDLTVLETVIMGNSKLYKIMKEKDALYSKEDFTMEDGMKVAELEEEFGRLNG